MKQIWYRSQFLVVIVLVTATAVLLYLMARKIDWHFDMTSNKLHSLPDETARVLRELKGKPLEIIAFFPKDDPARESLIMFLKDCQAIHDNLQFDFYDPVRRPKIAEQYQIDRNYTILIRSGDHEERVPGFFEEAFTNALFRIAHPRKLNLCFVTGHQELDLKSKERNGLEMFVRNLKNGEVELHEIVLARDGVPDICNVAIMAGPHQEPAADEFAKLRDAFNQGKGLVFWIDPMDLGAGQKFDEFFKTFGVTVGENVLIDKASRVVGGDILMPAGAGYTQHEAVKRMSEPTFFPVARTAQPWTDTPADLEVTPLVFSSEGSWAESDLARLEDGDATFSAQQDIAGPLPLAAAVETKKSDGGRMIVVGDSDFVTNGYLSISQNQDFAVSTLQWAAKDSRYIRVRPRRAVYKPLLLKEYERQGLLVFLLGIYPLALFIPISIYLFVRSKTS